MGLSKSLKFRILSWGRRLISKSKGLQTLDFEILDWKERIQKPFQDFRKLGLGNPNLEIYGLLGFIGYKP